ncbi:MAG: murein biosynthesis integral membrane protein MurJ [Treponema sp. GWB1_62_6]|nr:MAG: murein biosynthesis integral membrane protein MurJ [Treponema sp. GWB1_62_6]OHE69750.1 MAG: murein biosynthesis integral membrane protein MurJ [Treponema sp. GWC1_61_84]OHE76910.1 MAG: murein biosynthesis integral membrane protein MurJ [Treponema sp. RIFOXYC1_FULL_61_9]HCM26773.1 murein biosynthesis integral membrane protein MurJ [Treponema sp.]
MENRKSAPESSRGASLVRHGSTLSALTLVSRVLGLVREMVKAALLGTTALSDAFTVAFMIPNLLRRLFAEGSIAVAFIPTFKGYLIEEDKEKTKEFLSATFTFLSFFVTVAVLIGVAAAPLVVPIFGIKEFDETVFLTRIMFPYLACVSVAAFFQGILNTVHVFAPTGFAPILLNIVTIGAALLLSPFTANPARAMAVGVILGGLLEALVQLPFVLSRGFRFPLISLKRAFTNPGTRTVLRLIGPTIVGMAAYQLNDLVSTALAGNAGAGVVSSLQYSLRLQELILGVFAVSIGTVLLPDLAGHAKSGRWDEYNDRLVTAMDIIALITIPITFFALVQGELLVRLLFQARSFDENSVRLTTTAFMFHIPGLFFIALNRILAPAFYAQSDSKSPTMAGIASFAVNMALAALFVGPLRGGGVALALTVASAVNTVLLVAFLARNPKVAVGRAVRSASVYALRLALISVAAAAPLVFLGGRIAAPFAGRGRLVSYGFPLAISTLLYAAVGIGLLALTKDEQAKAVVRAFRRRGK